MKKLNFELIPLTGVHVGSGEVMSPMEYLVKNGKVLRFSLNKLIAGLNSSEKNYLLKLIDESEKDISLIKKIIKYLHDNVRGNNIEYIVEIDKSFYDVYNKKLFDIKNQLLINPTYRSQSNFSIVIPGSSIKGSIRTALLNYFLERKRDEYVKLVRENRIKKGNLLESIILKYRNVFDNKYRIDIKKDPLRALLVKDCTISGKKTAIVTKTEIYKKRTNAFQKQSTFYEVITGELLDGDALGKTQLVIDDDLLKSKKNNEFFFNERNISFDLIMEACNSFYCDYLIDYEYNKFYRNNLADRIEYYQLIEKLKEYEDDLTDNNVCLIRLGRFSQVESITFVDEKIRHPSTRYGYGKTRMLALYKNKYYPLGWVLLKPVN